MLKEKEMIKEIANLVIKRVNFSKIDFVKQRVRVTDFGNYEIFLGYQTDDLADAQIKSVIYEMAQVITEYDFSGEAQEIFEMYDFQDFDKYSGIQALYALFWAHYFLPPIRLPLKLWPGCRDGMTY